MSKKRRNTRKSSKGDNRQPEMILLPGGSFLMGADNFYAEEGPVREVRVESFAMDVTPVTHREFSRFIDATGYVTWAERTPTAGNYPDAAPGMLVAGSAVFDETSGPVDLSDPLQWWHYEHRACWKRPYGASVRFAEYRITRSRRSVITTPWPMRNGPARICQRKRNGNMRHAAGFLGVITPGATSCIPVAGVWPIPGVAISPGATTCLKDSIARPLWDCSRRMGLALSISSVMSGNGPATAPEARLLTHLPAAVPRLSPVRVAQ